MAVQNVVERSCTCSEDTLQTQSQIRCKLSNVAITTGGHYCISASQVCKRCCHDQAEKVLRSKVQLRWRYATTKAPPYCLSSPLIYMSSTHLCRHRANSLVLQRKKKGERCSDHIFYLIRPSPCPLAPLFPPFPVQLNAEPWIGWSRCLGRADIFETLPPPSKRAWRSFNRGLCGFLFFALQQAE